MKQHQPAERIIDAKQALKILRDGNRRFVQDFLCDKSTYTLEREILSEGQNPFAVVVCCSDSRVVPEIFFDQKMGDIFVIRNAGNVVDDVTLASMEYALESFRCSLVVVCGHSRCGAITAVCKGGHSLPHLQSLVQRIDPALKAGGNIEMVAQEHVRNMVAQLKQGVEDMGMKTIVVGAYYDIFSGEVLWLDEWIARGLALMGLWADHTG